LHRPQLDGVPRELLYQLQARAQRIDEAPLIEAAVDAGADRFR
jgi:hypothetical protein